MAAVIFASLSAVRIGGHPRPLLALAAIALLGVVGYARVRSQLTRPGKQSNADAYERALRIQEARERKFRR